MLTVIKNKKKCFRIISPLRTQPYLITNSFALCSPEAKPVLEDKLSEFSADLIAAYDSGELLGALEEGRAGWQKWVKNFGKSLKRKVIFN